MPEMESKTAILFSGGGARGAYSAGVALAFRRQGRCPEIVAGTSVGALTATMVITGEEERLAEIWRRLTPRQVFRKRLGLNFLLAFVSNTVCPGYSSEPLDRLIRQSTHVEKIRKSPRRLLVTCYNQTLQRVEYFDNHYKDLPRVLLASTSLPLVFPPVRMRGYEYVDMGATNIPLKSVISSGVEKVYVILSDHSDDFKRPIRNNLDWAIRVMHLAQRDNVQLDIELARRTNLATELDGYRFVELHVISPSRSLELGVMDFHMRHKINEALQLGLEDGTRFLNQSVPVQSPYPQTADPSAMRPAV